MWRRNKSVNSKTGKTSKEQLVSYTTKWQTGRMHFEGKATPEA
jgi:hypothetical protein